MEKYELTYRDPLRIMINGFPGSGKTRLISTIMDERLSCLHPVLYLDIQGGGKTLGPNVNNLDIDTYHKVDTTKINTIRITKWSDYLQLSQKMLEGNFSKLYNLIVIDTVSALARLHALHYTGAISKPWHEARPLHLNEYGHALARFVSMLERFSNKNLILTTQPKEVVIPGQPDDTPPEKLKHCINFQLDGQVSTEFAAFVDYAGYLSKKAVNQWELTFTSNPSLYAKYRQPISDNGKCSPIEGKIFSNQDITMFNVLNTTGEIKLCQI